MRENGSVLWFTPQMPAAALSCCQPREPRTLTLRICLGGRKPVAGVKAAAS